MRFTGLLLSVAFLNLQTFASANDETVDQKPHLVMLIAEGEYRTAETLPKFAQTHLAKDFQVTFVHASETDPNKLVGIKRLKDADVLLVSVRRRTLPTEDLQLVRNFVASGKPVIGIRTASHAFSLRKGTPPDGQDQWPEFDAHVFGGNYNGHYGNDLKSDVYIPKDVQHPVLKGFGNQKIPQGWSLYRTAPLAEGTSVLLMGEVDGKKPEPVAWTFTRKDGGRSFYTSLGHVDDFNNPKFARLMQRGICWAANVRPQK